MLPRQHEDAGVVAARQGRGDLFSLALASAHECSVGRDCLSLPGRSDGGPRSRRRSTRRDVSADAWSRQHPVAGWRHDDDDRPRAHLRSRERDRRAPRVVHIRTGAARVRHPAAWQPGARRRRGAGDAATRRGVMPIASILPAEPCEPGSTRSCAICSSMTRVRRRAGRARARSSTMSPPPTRSRAWWNRWFWPTPSAS